MEKSSKVFIGMDVHKESIDITLAEEGGEVRRLGRIGGDRGSAATRCAILSLRIYSSPVTTSARCRSCLGIRTSRRR
jgi:hypothetical protein